MSHTIEMAAGVESREKWPAPDESADRQRRSPTASEAAVSQSSSTSSTLSWGQGILYYFIFVFACLLMIACVPLAAIIWFFYPIDVSMSSHSKAEAKHPVYLKALQDVQQTSIQVVRLTKIIWGRLVILSLTWLIVSLTVPGLKKRELLGSKLWKWTLLFAVVSCGYNIISVTTRFFLYLLFNNKKLRREKAAKYYAQGLRVSVNLVAHTGAIILTWAFFFRTSRGIIRNPDDTAEFILHIVTWTFAALAAAAWLWLFKNIVLLKWEANAVYKRFSERILSAGFQLYFVSHICDVHLSIFQPKRSCRVEDNATSAIDDHHHDNAQRDQNKAETKEENENEAKNKEREGNANTAAHDKDTDQSEEKNKEMEENAKKAKNLLCIDKDATTYRIKKMTKYFIALSECDEFSREDGTSGVSKKCEKIKDKSRLFGCIKIEDLEVFKLITEEAEMLYNQLVKEQPQEKQILNEVSYRDFERWMVTAHKKCVELGSTLSDAREVVKVLDKVLTISLIAIAILAWLLLTDIASTKILVLIVSPLLATVFVFGDTCKSIFEGIIFSFVNHPFDVGDRCIIDNRELEVKRMSVLATKFIVVGTEEEALYPNSALATMPINNLKGEPDPTDSVELTLPNYTQSMFNQLQDKIIGLFKKKKGQYKQLNVVMKEIRESSIKMEIEFQHVMGINVTTHSGCLNKKRRQKSELLKEIKQCTEEIIAMNKNEQKIEDTDNKGHDTLQRSSTFK